MRSSIQLPCFLIGVVSIAACPATKADDTTITTTTAEESGDGSSTSLTTTTTSTTSDEESSSSGAPSESSSGGEVTTTTNGDTGDPECGPGIGCGVPAPDGWFGPMIFARTDGTGEPPACPEGYTDGPVVLEGFIDPGPAVCGCECTLSGSSCFGYMYNHSSASCNSYLNYTNVAETCTNLNIGPYATFYAYQQMAPTCTSEKTEEFPPALWESTIHSCKLADGAQSCNGDGVCQPNPPGDFEATSCIYQQGDVGCPAGIYNTKHLYSSGVDDTRDCGDCSCGVPASNCTGNMMVFTGQDCAGEPTALVPSSNACTTASGGSMAADYGTSDDCPVAGNPQPEGEVSPVGAFTFCCMG